MRKIMIIGSGGSGKSTLARTLGELIDIPVYHLDAFYWKPGWVPTPDEQWEDIQRKITQREKWIMDGNYSRTFDIRMAEADTIIFIDLSRWITIYRVIKRRVQYHGLTRPDLNEGCQETLDWEFIKWVWDFKKNKRPAILTRLKNLGNNKKIVILHSRKEVETFIKQVKLREDVETL